MSWNRIGAALRWWKLKQWSLEHTRSCTGFYTGTSASWRLVGGYFAFSITGIARLFESAGPSESNGIRCAILTAAETTSKSTESLRESSRVRGCASGVCGCGCCGCCGCGTSSEAWRGARGIWSWMAAIEMCSLSPPQAASQAKPFDTESRFSSCSSLEPFLEAHFRNGFGEVWEKHRRWQLPPCPGSSSNASADGKPWWGGCHRSDFTLAGDACSWPKTLALWFVDISLDSLGRENRLNFLVVSVASSVG